MKKKYLLIKYGAICWILNYNLPWNFVVSFSNIAKKKSQEIDMASSLISEFKYILWNFIETIDLNKYLHFVLFCLMMSRMVTEHFIFVHLPSSSSPSSPSNILLYLVKFNCALLVVELQKRCVLKAAQTRKKEIYKRRWDICMHKIFIRIEECQFLHRISLGFVLVRYDEYHKRNG